MKYFHIDNKIDKELLNRFLQFCNDNGEEDWTIVLHSVGGASVMSKSILYIINQRKEKCTLICNEAYSAAFYLFYEAECKKILCGKAKGMFHLPSIEMILQSNGKPYYTEDKTIVKNWKQSSDLDLKIVKKFMTKKEIKGYKKGDDIFFTSKRMKEIFPDAEII